jgi:hypothetical protein
VSINQTEKKKKLELIKKIIDNYLKENKPRDDNWYGEVFNELYDKSIVYLEVFLHHQT